MTNWIENYPEPRRLFLAWQAPDQLGDRFRWAVGELSVLASGQFELRYFRAEDEFRARNQGRTSAEIAKLGYGGYPAFGVKRETHRDGVSEVFLRRLPPTGRPDFGAYVSQFRIPPNTKASVPLLLSITEAKLPSDGFSIVDPLDPNAVAYDLMQEIAGYRYYAGTVAPLLVPGRTVDVAAEPDNKYDPGAVAFSIDGEKVGNVNRLQAPAFLRWLESGSVTAVVERLNGRPDHPRAFLFVRVRAQHQVAA